MTIEEIIKEAFSRGWNSSHECATDFDYDCALNGFLSEVETEVKKFRIDDVNICDFKCPPYDRCSEVCDECGVANGLKGKHEC